VKIFTARADDEKGVNAIKAWLKKHELPDLEVTNLKDQKMIEFWDDKAVQVRKNTGQRVGEAEDPKAALRRVSMRSTAAKGRLVMVGNPNEDNPIAKCSVCGHSGPVMDAFSYLKAGFNGIEAGDADDLDMQECGQCGAILDWKDTGQRMGEAEELRKTLPRFSREACEALWEDLWQGAPSFPFELADIEYALSTLNDREYMALWYRYEERRTLRRTGDATVQRPIVKTTNRGQLAKWWIDRALRRLRHCLDNDPVIPTELLDL
jgi:hypothetical protein